MSAPAASHAAPRTSICRLQAACCSRKRDEDGCCQLAYLAPSLMLSKCLTGPQGSIAFAAHLIEPGAQRSDRYEGLLINPTGPDPLIQQYIAIVELQTKFIDVPSGHGPQRVEPRRLLIRRQGKDAYCTHPGCESTRVRHVFHSVIVDAPSVAQVHSADCASFRRQHADLGGTCLKVIAKVPESQRPARRQYVTTMW